jgi:hypothetical protein
MESKIIKEVRFLKWYALTLTAVVVLFIIFSFAGHKPHFEEIDVERINIVEKNGQLKMVISNMQKQHPGMINGKSLPKRERPAGIIFFNSIGDECGGLVYDGNKKEAGLAFSVDQFKNDQIMQLNYDENGQGETKKRSYGLQLWDEPDNYPLERVLRETDSIQRLYGDSAVEQYYKERKQRGEAAAKRFFAGKNVNGEVGLFILDTKGKPRIKLYVDKQNNPRFEFLDENGTPLPAK